MFSIFEVESDVEVNGGNNRAFIRVDSRGGLEIVPYVTTTSTKDEMRYYSKRGESVVTKVYRINYGEDNMVLTRSLRDNATLDECNWCCKLFPVGMQKCPQCTEERFYCDKECLTKAWPVHRRKPAHAKT